MVTFSWTDENSGAKDHTFSVAENDLATIKSAFDAHHHLIQAVKALRTAGFPKTRGPAYGPDGKFILGEDGFPLVCETTTTSLYAAYRVAQYLFREVPSDVIAWEVSI